MKERNVVVPETYLNDLEKRVKDLQALFEVSALISSTLDYRELIRLVIEKAGQVMGAEACSILLYDRETRRLEFQVALGPEDEASETLKEKVSLKMGEGIAGWVAEHGKSLLIEDAESDDRFYREADRLTGFKTRSMIASPLIGRSGLIGVAEVINPVSRDSFTDYDVEMMETFCRQIAVAIENARFYRASIERENLRKELEIASVVQRSFLPDNPSISSGAVSASAYSIPARQVGGDMYDFVKLGGGRLGIFIGDVSGKGVSAALYMAKVVSEFRFLAAMGRAPSEVLSELNGKLMNAPRGMFLTCIYMTIDPGSGLAVCSNAGHPPFIRTRGEAVDIVEVESGPPLGIMPFQYRENSLTLHAGEGLLLITDGAIDARDMKGERLGIDRLLSVVREFSGEENLVQVIADYVDSFSRGVERADDLTLVGVFRGDEKQDTR